MDKEELAEYILSKIIGKHFQYVSTYTEFNEDGSVSIVKTEKSEAIYNDILKLLENEYNKK